MYHEFVEIIDIAFNISNGPAGLLENLDIGEISMRDIVPKKRHLL